MHNVEKVTDIGAFRPKWFGSNPFPQGSGRYEEEEAEALRVRGDG